MRTPPVMPDGMNDGPQSQPKENGGLRKKLRADGSDHVW